MLEVEPTGQCGRTAIGSGRNGNVAVVSVVSALQKHSLGDCTIDRLAVFARCASVELPSTGEYRFPTVPVISF